MGATASNLFGGGARSPKRLRRASDLPAIQSVEDLFPPEMFFKVVAGGYLEPEEIGNVACANRQFKETSYNPRMTTGRGCIALIGQGCSPSVPEAKKWFKIAAELHGTDQTPFSRRSPRVRSLSDPQGALCGSRARSSGRACAPGLPSR